MRRTDIRPATYAGAAWLVGSLPLALIFSNGDIAIVGLAVFLACLFAGGHSARWERRRALTRAADLLDALATARRETAHGYTDHLRWWADDESRWRAGSLDKPPLELIREALDAHRYTRIGEGARFAIHADGRAIMYDNTGTVVYDSAARGTGAS